VNSQNDTLERIREAFRLHCRSEHLEGLRRLHEIWDELDPDGDPFFRCLTAHYLADTQSDPNEALRWDMRALEVAESATVEGDATRPSAAALHAFYPSLHLNLADGFRKLGDFDSARRHADLGMESSAGLGLDAYGQNVRAGLVRVTAQIEELDRGPSVIFDFD